jgi:transcriptional regulator of acetoin/glycerol metabolism
VLDALAAHSWPGNVRELKHVVEWIAALSNGLLPVDAVRRALAQRASLGAARALDAEALERQRLRDVLEGQSWNTELAARLLGVHRATLYRRMKRLGLTVPLAATR